MYQSKGQCKWESGKITSSRRPGHLGVPVSLKHWFWIPKGKKGHIETGDAVFAKIDF